MNIRRFMVKIIHKEEPIELSKEEKHKRWEIYDKILSIVFREFVFDNSKRMIKDLFRECHAFNKELNNYAGFNGTIVIEYDQSYKNIRINLACDESSEEAKNYVRSANKLEESGFTVMIDYNF
jgi:hypothetical protein